LVDAEPMTSGEPARKRLDVALVDLDDGSATSADEMVVMPRRTEAIRGLATLLRDDLDCPLGLQRREGPVHGGQPDARGDAAGRAMQVLRGELAVAGPLEDGDDSLSRSGGAHERQR
jgi:hypothetical protein